MAEYLKDEEWSEHTNHVTRDSNRRARASIEAFVWSVVLVPVVVFLLIVKRPGGPFWTQFFNACHVAISGIVVLVALRLSRGLLNQVRKPWLHYSIALFSSTVLGVGLEIAQLFVPGEASLSDIGRDFVGACCAAVWASTVDSDLRDGILATSRRRWLLVLAAAVAFLSTTAPFIRICAAVVHRNWIFPVLVNFDSALERPFVVPDNGAQLSIVAAPREFVPARGRATARVTFAVGSEYPKLEILGPFCDWSQYGTVAFDVFSLEESEVTITLRIDDKQHRGDYVDRFNRRLTIRHGGNAIKIPLDEVRRSPATRLMDLSSIKSVAIFAHSPARTFSLYFQGFRLER